MFSIDLDQEKLELDRAITYANIPKAKAIISRGLKVARNRDALFFRYYFCAQYYMLKNDFDRAVRFLDRARDLDPYDGCVYNDLALCFVERYDYDKAFELFDIGIEKDKDCASLYNNKGWLLNFLGDHKNACMCFRKALEMEGDRAETFFNLGDSCFFLGDFDSAKKYLTKAAKLIQGHSQKLYDMVKERLSEIPGVSSCVTEVIQ